MARPICHDAFGLGSNGRVIPQELHVLALGARRGFPMRLQRIGMRTWSDAHVPCWTHAAGAHHWFIVQRAGEPRAWALVGSPVEPEWPAR